MTALVEMPDAEGEIERIAQEIELLQGTAAITIIRIGERLKQAQEKFRYVRASNGFAGWVESRLNFSRRTAYRFIGVYERFGTESVQKLHTFSSETLCLLAEPSTPEDVRAEVIEKADAGERLTLADVRRAVDEARLQQVGQHQAEVARLRAEADQREAAVRAEFEGGFFVKPEELQAKIDEVVLPLKKRAERLQDQIDGMKRNEQARIEAERAKRSKQEAKAEKRPAIDAAASLNEINVRRTLADFAAAAMRITPDEAMAIAERSAKATEQTVERWIGDSREHAKAAIAWLTEFLKRTQ